METIIKDGNLVIPHCGVRKADIHIKGERIFGISESIGDLRGKKVINAKGKFVFPGLIDPHVHLGNTFPFFEDVESETSCAAAGGVTTILVFLKAALFDSGFPSYRRVFKKVLKDMLGLAYVDFSFHFHIPIETYIDEIPDYYKEYGIQSIKFHMGYKPSEGESKDEYITERLQKISPGIDDGVIYDILKKISETSPPPLALVHAEADDIIKRTSQSSMEGGLSGLKAWDAARPDFAEEMAIMRVGYLARRTNAPIYIVHVSSALALEAVRNEKRLGTRIIAETCPHYLSLSHEDTNEEQETFGKVAPPIRGKRDVEVLWEGIRDGTISCVGTDHSAKPRKAKTKDIWNSILGMPGLETMLPTMITEATKRQIPLTRVSELCCYNVARIFQLLPNKGTIAPGSDADLVIVDLENEVEIKAENLHSVSGFTPFEGKKVKGWPTLTMLRGNVIYENGNLLEKGCGKFVPRFPGRSTGTT
jgi:dihydropyrimidinase